MHLKCAPKCYFNVFTGHIAAVFKWFLLPCTLSYPLITFGAHWQNIGDTLKHRSHLECVRYLLCFSMCLQCSADVLQMLSGDKIEYMGVKTVENILNTAAMCPVKTLK